MEWVSQHSEAISAISSILTLLVWFFYAQLLYNSYARQRRPRIIINRGEGTGLNALCLISNMSNEAIYIKHLVAIIHLDGQSYPLDVVDYKKAKSEDDGSYLYATHQGPLASGSYLHIQSFWRIAQQIMQHWELEEATLFQSEEPVILELRVIAIYGSEDSPVGALRRFILDWDAAPAQQLMPTTIDTQRLNKRRQRRQVKKWIYNIETQQPN